MALIAQARLDHMDEHQGSSRRSLCEKRGMNGALHGSTHGGALVSTLRDSSAGVFQRRAIWSEHHGDSRGHRVLLRYPCSSWVERGLPAYSTGCEQLQEAQGH